MADKDRARRAAPDGRPKVVAASFGGDGRCPRAVSIDDELTPDAKALYFYFSSLAGPGETMRPCRSAIMADLGIGRDRYYEALVLLTGQGYITAANGRAGSAYAIAPFPVKYYKQPADIKKLEAYAQVLSRGVMSLGCGTIPKAVMLDPRLTVTAKAIYGYLASFACEAGAAYPRIADTLSHLGVSESTYRRHYGLLADLNYVTPPDRAAGGRLGPPEIVLNAMPGAPGPAPPARPRPRAGVPGASEYERRINPHFLFMEQFRALSCAAKLLYMVLWSTVASGECGCRREPEGKYSVSCTQVEIAVYLGVSERSASMAVHELVEAGVASEDPSLGLGQPSRLHFWLASEVWMPDFDFDF